MSNTKPAASPELQAAWSVYWTAFRAGNTADMAKAYTRIEHLQRLETSRKSTTRMLAVISAALP